MNANDNPYSILGISKDADDEKIKKAYRKAAKLNHPDKQSNEEERKLATERFAKIADAYALLNDPVRRYDWRQANENSNQSSTSRRSSMPKRSSAATSGAPSSVHRSASFGPSQSPRRRSDSSVNSASTRSSTRSSSSTGRRKSRVSIGRSPQPSKGRRASSNLPVRESVRKPIRRTASLESNMHRSRLNVNGPTVRSSTKPMRPVSSFNSLPKTSTTESQKANIVKGRKKSRASLGPAPIQGRRLRRVV